jgi:hypothetical protein
MILSRLGPTSNICGIDLGKRTVDLNYNWTDAHKKYELYQILKII